MVQAQTVQPAPEPASLEGELSAHPYATGLLITLLFAAFVGLVKWALVQFERRMNEKFAAQDARDDEQDRRLGVIDMDLREYATHVALGTKEAEDIHGSVKRVELSLSAHVQKEETVTWKKIDDLVDAVNVMRLANETAHGLLTTGQATLGVRVAAVENKMPNGELERLAAAYHALAARDLSGGPWRPAVRRKKR